MVAHDNDRDNNGKGGDPPVPTDAAASGGGDDDNALSWMRSDGGATDRGGGGGRDSNRGRALTLAIVVAISVVDIGHRRHWPSSQLSTSRPSLWPS